MSNHKAVINAEPLFSIGDIVKHRLYPFRGVIVDVDPEFDNTDEWYDAIPEEVRPEKEQPFYHLLAENSDSYYAAYVSQQNLLTDKENGPVSHPDVDDVFDGISDGKYTLRREAFNYPLNLLAPISAVHIAQNRILSQLLENND